jgi:membrane dipeptidase
MKIVVDAHEDIAWNMLSFKRDYTRPLSETRRIEAGGEVPKRNGTALLGWDAWQQGKVAVIFATLHAAPYRRREGAWDSQVYRDSEQAHRQYSKQLDLYERLTEEHADKFQLIKTTADLDQILTDWEAGGPAHIPIGLVILMEGADAVRRPEELEKWYARGVRLVGPAWAGTRYAGGTGEPGPLTNEGWALLEVMAELDLILDLSHLAEEAALQALDHYPGTLIASHSNARSLVGRSAAPDRHLADETIRMIGARGGVIGVVPYNKFLDGEWRPSDGRERLNRYDLIAQIDHICQLTGCADHVGIGSDFDGGLGLEHVPAGFESVADLLSLDRELGEYGYSADQVEKILAGNWLRVLRQALPEN